MFEDFILDIFFFFFIQKHSYYDGFEHFKELNLFALILFYFTDK